MNTFQLILGFTVPSITMGIIVFLMLKMWVKNEDKKRRFELAKENSKETMQSRLLAYERLVLFLERINPESMMVRIPSQGLNCYELHGKLLKIIREEFEHNVTQQLYVSKDAWLLVKNAKESIVQLINMSVASFPPQVPAIELVKQILDAYNNTPNSPTQIALDFLDSEIKMYFS